MNSNKNFPEYFPQDWHFGTDGIRGPVETKMNPLFMVKLGWATGSVLKDEGITKILIGKDTMISGYMIESALEAGFISAGMDVILLGPLPTPAVAYLAKSYKQAGLVISASHNSYEDNGIKFFNKDGFKLSFNLEKKIEGKLFEESSVVESIKLGKANRLNDAQGRYIEFCKSCSEGLDLTGLSLVVDCAHGANYSVGPRTFAELGASVIALGVSPNGININDQYGSTNPKELKKKVLSNKADLGIAFDGDGDRLLIVDNKGKVLDGDDLLYTLISTNILDKEERKSIPGVVGTLMTNKSLEIFLNKSGINFCRTDVGDKFILRELIKRKWTLGGEPSGHIICLDSTTTGDALIASLRILSSISKFDFDISKILNNFDKFPQELVSLNVRSPQTVIMDRDVRTEVFKLEQKLGNKGRVLLRPSGTEPVIRIMVEATSKSLAKELANRLAELIKKAA